MSVDLRTDINDCESDAQTFTTSGGALDTNTSTGDFYEGTASVETQHSVNNDRTSTTTDSAGTTLALDLTDATVYILVKDNLLDTFEKTTPGNGGAQIVLGDGTDLIGYPVGGNNAVGMSLPFFFTAFKLDVSEVVATPPSNVAVYSGSEAALAQASISVMGYGSLHLAKAVGNIANVKIDAMCYIANDSYALRINGGTIGTPETMADVQADDVGGLFTSLAYGGMVANPLGSQFQFFAPTEWGEPAANADAYFTATGEEWYLLGDNAGGHAMGAGHVIFRVVGNATDTISFVLDNVVIISTGTRAIFDFSDTNITTLDMTSVTFTGLAAITFQVAAAGLALDSCIFNDCDQIYLSTIAATDCIFNGTTNANGAILLDTTLQTVNQTGIRFISDGAGHGIEITQAGTYNLTGWLYSGYTGTTGTNDTPSSGGTDTAIFNNSGGVVILNISGGGDSPSVRNSAVSTTTVNANVEVTLTGMKDNTEVRVCAAGDPNTALAGIENATAGTVNDRSFAFSLSAATSVDIIIFNIDWILPPNNRISAFSIPSVDGSIPISQIRDRNFSNPV
jgi:hypothetical protein